MLVRRHPNCKVVYDQLHHRHDEGYTTVGVRCAFRWWLRRGSSWFRSQPICLLHASLSLWCFFPPQQLSTNGTFPYFFCSCCLDSTRIGSFSITIKFRLDMDGVISLEVPWRHTLRYHVGTVCLHLVARPRHWFANHVPCVLHKKGCCGFVLLFINTKKGFGKYVSLLLLKHTTRNRM